MNELELKKLLAQTADHDPALRKVARQAILDEWQKLTMAKSYYRDLAEMHKREAAEVKS